MTYGCAIRSSRRDIPSQEARTEHSAIAQDGQLDPGGGGPLAGAPATQERAGDPPPPLPPAVDVAVVGAGFGGLGCAIQLERQGLRDFVVLERAPSVGGTWGANTYPGCQCDVPSNLYSFSFAPKADWTHSYPEQPQIHAYLSDCARRFGIVDRIHLRCEMLAATWMAGERRWRIETSAGTLNARVLVAAPGLLSEPSLPRCYSPL